MKKSISTSGFVAGSLISFFVFGWVLDKIIRHMAIPPSLATHYGSLILASVIVGVVMANLFFLPADTKRIVLWSGVWFWVVNIGSFLILLGLISIGIGGWLAVAVIYSIGDNPFVYFVMSIGKVAINAVIFSFALYSALVFFKRKTN